MNPIVLDGVLSLIAGALGAFVHEMIHDNTISLPKISDGELYLGVLGGMIVGGIVGHYMDGSFIAALSSGFMGKSLLPSLLSPVGLDTAPASNPIEQTIRLICLRLGQDPDLAIRVAKCESSLNPRAINTNRDGSRDRGLFQINEKYHPEVTDDQAFDPEFATQFFCDAVKNGHLSWWDASKTCWNKVA